MLKYRVYNCHGALTGEGIPTMIEHVKKCMRSAVEHNMNMFVMAKDWPIQASNVVTYKYFPPLQEFVDLELAHGYIDAYKVLLDYAAELKLPFYTSYTELGVPKAAYEKYPEWRASRLEAGQELQPDTNPCFSHPYTKEHFQAKVREMCEIVPEAAGFELWLGEKESNVLYCMCEKCRDIPASERILSLILWMHETMKQYAPHKKLLVRSYLCAGRCFHEPDVFLPIADRLPGDIIFSYIGQYGDFDYLNDLHPLAGRLPVETIVEFDAGGEYRGFYYGYFSAITDYFEKRMAYYLEQGASGFMFRHIDWLGDVNLAEAYAISKLCAGPTKSGREYELEYLSQKFGQEAAELFCELMRVGAEICEKDLHILGCNAFGCFGIFPDTLQRLRYNVFDHCARMKAGAAERLLRCIDDPAEALAEKDQAVAVAKKFETLLERLRPVIPDRVYQGLRLSAEVMTLMIAPHKLLTELLFAYMRYERTVFTEDRMHAIYYVKNVTGRLRAWVAEKGDELKAVDLPKLRELQGLWPEVQTYFNNRFPYIYVEAISILCDRIDNSFEAGWEYYKWDIIL